MCVSVLYLSLHFVCMGFMLFSLFPVARYDLLPFLPLFGEKLFLPLQLTLERRRLAGYNSDNLQHIKTIRKEKKDYYYFISIYKMGNNG